MKKLFLVTFLLLFAATSNASQKAITDTGEQVILKSDGTWVYADKGKRSDQKIETNTISFVKPKDSTFLLKSTKNKSAFWINPVKWSFRKNKDDTVTEYEFQLKGKDLYSMAVTEGIEAPLESLVDIALINAKKAASDAKIVKQEYRFVNGKKLIYMEINCTIKGINFTYLGYYYTNSAGSTQLVTFTATNLVKNYEEEIINLLNGLDTQ